MLNAEADSFASAFFILHEAWLVAVRIGVSCRRREAGFRARRRLWIEAVSGRVSPNERVVPGVQSPDGSLDYFVDEALGAPTLWENDFVLIDIDGPVEVGPLARIDHVCLSVAVRRCARYLGAVLSQRVRLRDRSGRADPYGLVRSRAVRSRDGSASISLNASMDRYTAVSESLTTYRGSGLNHVAFSTPDIFDAVPRLEADGVKFLRIPRNYYDDLVARFGLPDELIDTMHEHNILYGRDERGASLTLAGSDGFDFCIEATKRNYVAPDPPTAATGGVSDSALASAASLRCVSSSNRSMHK